MAESSRAPDPRIRVIESLAAVPVLTAATYTLGAAYAAGFYGRIGIDNLDLLGFSVQTYIAHSFLALRTITRSFDVLSTLVLVCSLALAIYGWFAHVPMRVYGGAGLVLGITALLSSPTERGILALGLLALASGYVYPKLQFGYGSGGRQQLLAIAATVVVWLVLLPTSAAAGRERACEIAAGDDRITPLVEVTVELAPYVSSAATPVVELDQTGAPSSRLTNLRLYTTVPAGLIVYADNELPERLIFLPTSNILSVAVQPDGGNVVSGSGNSLPSWC